MYGVKKLREEIEVEVIGMKSKIDLSWYDGMRGAIPVFDTYKQALDYADNDYSLVFELYLRDEK